MADKAIIYITNSSLVIYRWKRQRLVEELRLTEVENAKQPLSLYFQQYGNKPIKVVVDVLEEMNSLESLPHLNARDRKAMIERKQKQLFPGLRFVYSRYKGRGRTERRDDLVLFSAITDERFIDSWLQVLFELEIKVAGIFSLAVLLESLVEQLQGETDKMVISVFDDKQGMLLRQSYFKDNNLVLSRFKHINELDRQRQADEIEEDVNRSQRFVVRHFNIRNGDNLSVYFFGSGLGLFDKINFSKIGINPTYISTKGFAKKQGNEVADKCSLAAYVTGLAANKTRQRTHYKDAKSSFFYNHFVLKVAINSMSIVFIGVAAIYATTGFINHFSQQQQADEQRNTRSQIVQKLANTAQIPLFKGYEPNELVNHLQALENVKEVLVSPGAIMRSISLVLEHFPVIRMTRLEWGEEKQQDDSMNVDALIDPTEAGFIGGPVLSTKPGLLISLQAQLEPFDGDFRYALDLIGQFSAELEATESITKVTATKLPVDVSTENELTGAINTQKFKAEFILDIEWQR